MKFWIPAKIFLLGEYIALRGLPSLVACTQPFFELEVEGHSEGLPQIFNIHLKSPAGRFIEAQGLDFESVRFHDPYHGQGGVGASTAQFLGCFYASKHTTCIDLNDLLATYRTYTFQNQGFPPSGVDLIAQTAGGICYVDRIKNEQTVFAWPWPHLSLRFIRTRQKVLTHQHLAELTSLPEGPFEELVLQATQALLQKDPDPFIFAINEYGTQMALQHFVTAETQTLLAYVKQHPACLAAKGSGALGADIVMAVIVKEAEDIFETWLSKHHVSTFATEDALAFLPYNNDMNT